MIDHILMFWFGPLDSGGFSPPTQHSRWFHSGANIDRECEALFGAAVKQAIAGDLAQWAASDRGLLALILLLDQLPRNIYRGTAAAYSGDVRALALAQQAIAERRHLELPAIHRVFLYMPLEHSEDLPAQEQCVALFEELAAATGAELVADFGRYAVVHRDIIAKFGRYPHRNVVLGRESTPAELEHLERHGGF